jgi:TolA-binding protein
MWTKSFVLALLVVVAAALAPAGAAQRGPITSPPDPELEAMAKHNLEVAEYYFSKKKAYVGAKDRLLEIVGVYPEYTRIDRVYFLLGEALVKTNQGAQAREYFERLLSERPDSEHAKPARERLASLPPAPPGEPKLEEARPEDPEPAAPSTTTP